MALFTLCILLHFLLAKDCAQFREDRSMCHLHTPPIRHAGVWTKDQAKLQKSVLPHFINLEEIIPVDPLECWKGDELCASPTNARRERSEVDEGLKRELTPPFQPLVKIVPVAGSPHRFATAKATPDDTDGGGEQSVIHKVPSPMFQQLVDRRNALRFVPPMRSYAGDADYSGVDWLNLHSQAQEDNKGGSTNENNRHTKSQRQTGSDNGGDGNNTGAGDEVRRKDDWRRRAKLNHVRGLLQEDDDHFLYLNSKDAFLFNLKVKRAKMRGEQRREQEAFMRMQPVLAEENNDDKGDRGAANENNRHMGGSSENRLPQSRGKTTRRAASLTSPPPHPPAKMPMRTRVAFVTAMNKTTPFSCISQASAALAHMHIHYLNFLTPYNHVGRFDKYLEFIEKEKMQDDDVLVAWDSDIIFTGESPLPYLQEFIYASPRTRAEMNVAMIRTGQHAAPIIFPAEKMCMALQLYETESACGDMYDDYERQMSTEAKRYGFLYNSNEGGVRNPFRFTNGGTLIARVWAFRLLHEAVHMFTQIRTPKYIANYWYCDQTVVSTLFVDLLRWELDQSLVQLLKLEQDVGALLPPSNAEYLDDGMDVEQANHANEAANGDGAFPFPRREDDVDVNGMCRNDGPAAMGCADTPLACRNCSTLSPPFLRSHENERKGAHHPSFPCEEAPPLFRARYEQREAREFQSADEQKDVYVLKNLRRSFGEMLYQPFGIPPGFIALDTTSGFSFAAAEETVYGEDFTSTEYVANPCLRCGAREMASVIKEREREEKRKNHQQHHRRGAAVEEGSGHVDNLLRDGETAVTDASPNPLALTAASLAAPSFSSRRTNLPPQQEQRQPPRQRQYSDDDADADEDAWEETSGTPYSQTLLSLRPFEYLDFASLRTYFRRLFRWRESTEASGKAALNGGQKREERGNGGTARQLHRRDYKTHSHNRWRERLLKFLEKQEADAFYDRLYEEGPRDPSHGDSADRGTGPVPDEQRFPQSVRSENSAAALEAHSEAAGLEEGRLALLLSWPLRVSLRALAALENSFQPFFHRTLSPLLFSFAGYSREGDDGVPSSVSSVSGNGEAQHQAREGDITTAEEVKRGAEHVSREGRGVRGMKLLYGKVFEKEDTALERLTGLLSIRQNTAGALLAPPLLEITAYAPNYVVRFPHRRDHDGDSDSYEQKEVSWRCWRSDRDNAGEGESGQRLPDTNNNSFTESNAEKTRDTQTLSPPQRAAHQGGSERISNVAVHRDVKHAMNRANTDGQARDGEMVTLAVAKPVLTPTAFQISPVMDEGVTDAQNAFHEVVRHATPADLRFNGSEETDNRCIEEACRADGLKSGLDGKKATAETRRLTLEERCSTIGSAQQRQQQQLERRQYLKSYLQNEFYFHLIPENLFSWGPHLKADSARNHRRHRPLLHGEQPHTPDDLFVDDSQAQSPALAQELSDNAELAMEANMLPIVMDEMPDPVQHSRKSNLHFHRRKAPHAVHTLFDVDGFTFPSVSAAEVGTPAFFDLTNGELWRREKEHLQRQRSDEDTRHDFLYRCRGETSFPHARCIDKNDNNSNSEQEEDEDCKNRKNATPLFREPLLWTDPFLHRPSPTTPTRWWLLSTRRLRHPVAFHFSGGWKEYNYETYKFFFSWFLPLRMSPVGYRRNREVLETAAMLSWTWHEEVTYKLTDMCGIPI